MRKTLIKVLMAVLTLTLMIGVTSCTRNYDDVKPLNSYNITVVGGTGTGVYNEGSNVTISAKLTEEQVFVGWYEGETEVSKDAEYSFEASKDLTITAVVADKYSEVVVVGGGYIEATGNTQEKFEVGTEVTIVADDNYTTKEFESFKVGEEVITTNPYTFTMTKESVIVETVYAQTKCFIYVDGGKLNGVEETAAKYFEIGEEVTISYEASPYAIAYFHSWYTEENGVKTTLTRSQTYTFEVTKSMFIHANLQSGFDLEVVSGTIASTDSSVIENGTVSDEAVESSAKLFENATTTITYVAKNNETEGFRYWYKYNVFGEIEILSYDNEYSFTATEDMKIFADIGDDTRYSVVVEGGTIEGEDDTTTELLNGRQVTVKANAGEGIFQGWKLEGYMYSDGTDVILSYNPTFTFTVDKNMTITASYSNKLTVPSSVETNDIFYYKANGSNLQYMLFFNGTTNGIFSTSGVDGVTLYFYEEKNDNRNNYVATAYTTGKKVTQGTALTNVWYGTWSPSTGNVVKHYDTLSAPNGCYLFTLTGKDGETVNLLTNNWSTDTGLMLFEGGTTREFWLALADVIPTFSATHKYYVGMQLMAKDGYEDSNITTSSGIAIVKQENLRSNVPATVPTIEVAADYYKVSVDGTVVDSRVVEGQEVTLTVPIKTGYVFEGWTVVSGDVTITDNKFTMPAGNVEITSQMSKVDYTITNSTVENGTVEVATSAQYGDTVTVTVTPNEDYTVYHIYAVDKNIEFVQDSTDTTKYTFVMPADDVEVVVEFKKEGSYVSPVNITVAGGTISGFTGTAVTVEEGEKVTVVATASDDGSIFQGWKTGVVKADGTEVVTSYNKTYTFTASKDVTLSASYSNKLVTPSYVTLNDIFRYGVNNGNLQYLEFLRFTNNGNTADVFKTANTNTVKLYVYANVDDAREDYLATLLIDLTAKKIITASKDGLLTGEISMNSWTTGIGIYFEGGQTVLSEGLKKVITGYDASSTYFFAMQLVAEEGYEDSSISSCSRIGYTQTGTRSNTPVPEVGGDVEVNEYEVTFTYKNADGSTHNDVTIYSENDEIAIPTAPAVEGFTFVGWFTAEVGGTEVTLFPQATENVTYYAQYTVDSQGETTPLEIPSYVTANEIFFYDMTIDGEGVMTQCYLKFTKFTLTAGNIYAEDGVSAIKLYVYDSYTADKDAYVATITITVDETSGANNGGTNFATFTMNGVGDTADKTASCKGNWISNGTNVGINYNSFYSQLKSVIANYDASANYFFAMQMVAEVGSEYSDSAISEKSAIAYTESGVKSNTPVTDETVNPDEVA